MSHVEDSEPRPIFRVSFTGPWLDAPVINSALDGEDLRWEGSGGHVDEPIQRHRALVGAVSENEAIATVREALATLGYFDDFQAGLVRDSRGEVMLTPIRSWTDIDWEEVQRKVTLTELQRDVLLALLNDHEPTWIVAQDPDVRGDRDGVEVALRDLEARNLVRSRRAESGEAGRECALEDWWALTGNAWDLLGLIKSPRY
jgi:hypothetical protein